MASAFSVEGTGPMPMTSGSTPAKANDTRRAFFGQAELVGDVLGDEQRGGGAVVEAGSVAGGDAAVRAERGLEPGEALEGGLGARRLVDGGETPAGARRCGARPARGRAGSCRRRTPWPSSPGCARAYSSARSLVRCGKRSCRFSAVLPMSSASGSTSFSAMKRGFGSMPSPMGWRPMCSTPPATTTSYAPTPMPLERLVTAVIAPAHMRSTRMAGHAAREAGEDARGAAEGEALVADLRGRGDGDVVDALGRQARGCGAAARGTRRRRGRRRGSRRRCRSCRPCRRGCGRRRRRRRRARRGWGTRGLLARLRAGRPGVTGR